MGWNIFSFFQLLWLSSQINFPLCTNRFNKRNHLIYCLNHLLLNHFLYCNTNFLMFFWINKIISQHKPPFINCEQVVQKLDFYFSFIILFMFTKGVEGNYLSPLWKILEKSRIFLFLNDIVNLVKIEYLHLPLF